MLLGDSTRLSVIAVGNFTIHLGADRCLILKDCLYVLGMRRNLVSVSSLVKDGYSVCFDDRVVICFNKHFIYSSTLVDNLYIIKPINYDNREMNNSIILPHKRKEPSNEPNLSLRSTPRSY